MTWNSLLAAAKVKAEPTSKGEIDNLRSIVMLRLRDMAVAGLSDEQRFITGYDAARTLSLMVVRACGYRPGRIGGHYITFAALVAADSSFATAADFFDDCRELRNQSEYDVAGGIGKSEADDLARIVHKFHAEVEAWITARYPSLA